ncbi:MAG TPA: barstar family protein [Ktedonobacterales bacterium]
MDEPTSPDARQLWQNLKDAEHAFHAARMALFRVGDIADILYEALHNVAERGTALRVLLIQPEQARRRVFPRLIELASVGHRDIQLVRDVILSMDRQWVLEHIGPEVDRVLDSALEYEEYRRLAELLGIIGSPHLAILVARAAASDDHDTSEVAEDYGTRSELFTLGSPFILLTDLTAEAFTNLQLELAGDQNDVVVRTIRGRKCRTYRAFFDEVGAALQFPHYFGENFNAFNDCITDLEWLPGSAYLLLFADAELVLCEENFDAFIALARHLARAGEEWWRHPNDHFPRNRPPTPFHALFQCSGRGLLMVARRLTEAGVEYREWTPDR